MAVPTYQRQKQIISRTINQSANRYQGYETTRAAVGAANWPTYPDFYPKTAPVVRPQTKTEVKPEKERVAGGINRKKMVKTFCQILTVVALCFLMIYRYAMILESNDKITKLTAQVAELNANNQAMQDKLDRGLELGSLETYATEELGMIRPDSTQIFYVDVQLENVAAYADEEKTVLQGTPGALVHAIRVLK